MAGCGAFSLTGCKKQNAAAGGGAFPTQVVAVKASREPITETLSVVGTVRANEFVEVKAEVDGIIKALHFEEGQRVQKGDLLVELDDAELKAMLAEAEANQRLAKSKYDRSQELLQTRAVSQQEADEARAAFDARGAQVERIAEQLKDMRIVAPFEGVIGARLVSPGQVITKQQMLTTIVDLDPVKVEGNIPERFLSLANIGAKFQLRIAAFPNEIFEGELYFVAPELDSVNRTAMVKARVPNPEMRLKPGMFASSDLTLRVKEDAIVIPEAALMPQGEAFAVIVVDAEMTANIRRVKPGVRTAGRVEILEGLSEGETIVVEGWQKTRPGGKVTFAPDEKAAPYTAEAK